MYVCIHLYVCIRYEMKNDSYPVLTSEEINVTTTLQNYIINIKQQ